MICCWQTVRGSTEWRFQTDVLSIYQRLKKRKGFKLIAYGFNYDCWIFTKSFKKPENARKSLRRISNQEIFFNSNDNTFYAKNISTEDN